MAKLINFLIWFIVCLGVFCHVTTGDRQLEVLVNPYCNDLCNGSPNDPLNSPVFNASFNNLVYVKATGPDNVLHYLWSSVGTFSLLFAVTDLHSELIVNWTEFSSGNTSGSISFDPAPTYAAAVVFTNLYYYDDSDDAVDISRSKDVNRIPLDMFPWEGVQVDNSSERQSYASFLSSDTVGNPYAKGLQFNLNAYGYLDHAIALPSLLHTEDSFQLEMVLNGFNASLSENLRFVMEMAVVSLEDKDGDGYDLNTHKTIDDEYTPGVFTTVELTSAKSRASSGGAYLQWKPVCYTATSRTTADSTVTQQSLELNFNDSRLHVPEMERSLAYAFFGAESIDNTSAAWMNVSYGLAGDGFYQGFMSWTVTIGTGKPPEESFSTMVIAIIIVGFGVPGILIIVAGIIILVRRCRQNKNDDNYSNDRLVDSEQ